MSNRNNSSSHRSAFAESAYAYATGRSNSNRDEDDYNIVHAEFQPLAGSSVVIIANTSKHDKVTNAHTLKLMEERESLGCAVESMGGRWVHRLEEGDGDITHAIWIDDEKQRQGQRQLSHLSHETLVKLNICLAIDIPGKKLMCIDYYLICAHKLNTFLSYYFITVVSPNWLMAIGKLLPGQHWSEVNVEDHIPSTIQLFYDVNRSPTYPHRNSSGGSSISSSRRDAATSLSASIGETYQNLINENPDVIEEDALKRALEMSMLDFAIVHHINNERRGSIQSKKSDHKSPHDILQVGKDASPLEIKNAYRRRALETHPDKGGDASEFAAVARAYRVLLNAANNTGLDSFSFERDEGGITLKSTAHWDAELKEHRNLVRELFTAADQNLDENLQRQHFALDRLGLCYKDAGSHNYNEQNDMIRNSCFYLSLASSYLSGIGALAIWDKSGESDINEGDKILLQEADDALISETALQLKRVIEAAVLSAHPEWAAKGMVGEEVQAFSDFLVYILESRSIVSDWAVVVFDDTSGFVDIYKGQHYKDEEEGKVEEAYAASNTLTLRYVPGHYQPLVLATTESTRPTLKQVIAVLDESNVLYVVTDGAAQ